MAAVELLQIWDAGRSESVRGWFRCEATPVSGVSRRYEVVKNPGPAVTGA